MNSITKTQVFLAILFLTRITTIGQTCEGEQIKIEYSNGIEIFTVCKHNPHITFNEEKKYYWYTEFSKIKSTKGGSGGKLLNGNYKLYDEKYNLKVEKNYYLGLPDGNEMSWDSLGNINSKATVEQGVVIYQKFLNVLVMAIN